MSTAERRMPKAECRILKPGLLTTVQDLGRWGYQHRGVSVAGPMDLRSHRRANALVGNEERAATMEITVLGPVIQLESAAIMAISGAAFQVRVGEFGVEGEGPHDVGPGDIVRIGRCIRGARAYLAVRGGIDVPVVLGSRATHLPSRLGGVDGRPLAASDRLRIGSAVSTASAPIPAAIRLPDGGARVRVIPGPDAMPDTPATTRRPDRTSNADVLAWLTGQRFVLASQSNRMGYRLRDVSPAAIPPGALSAAGVADRLSSATPMGTIQLPPSGEPIVLMADCQTTGGYLRMATVISADLPIVGQLAPGDWIEFETCDEDAALRALREQERDLA
jgi:antagonist of KipI